MRKTLALLLAAAFFILGGLSSSVYQKPDFGRDQQVSHGRQSYTQPLYRRAGDHRP